MVQISICLISYETESSLFLKCICIVRLYAFSMYMGLNAFLADFWVFHILQKPLFYLKRILNFDNFVIHNSHMNHITLLWHSYPCGKTEKNQGHILTSMTSLGRSWWQQFVSTSQLSITVYITDSPSMVGTITDDRGLFSSYYTLVKSAGSIVK